MEGTAEALWVTNSVFIIHGDAGGNPVGKFRLLELELTRFGGKGGHPG